ncbi:MAG: regulatory protein GemA [Syntrophorhabdaceae bacterium]|nr:regulatory protein GemA [Syntrophorhabdaceae bacterium]
MSGAMMTHKQAETITAMLSGLTLSEKRYGRLFARNGIDPDGDLSSETVTFEQAAGLIGSLNEVYFELKGKKITKEQIRKIHTLKSALDLPDDVYRKGLEDMFCVETSKVLTARQAVYLIDVLEMEGITNGVWSRREYRDKYNELGRRPDMATPAQLRKIEASWNGLYPENDERLRQKNLRAFLFKFFKVSDLRFLDGETANKVLYALRNMTRRKETTPKNAPETHLRGQAG